jgi:hypothetical protein
MAIEDYSHFERDIFPTEDLFPFPLATVELIHDYFYNRQRATNCSVRFPSWDDSLGCNIKGDVDGEGDGDREGNEEGKKRR